MVQALAKAILAKAERVQAQDIYILPRADQYDLFLRIGDERRLVDVYQSDRMAPLISHFKFVAGMIVGEKRRCQVGSCDYKLSKDKQLSLRLSSVGDYRGKESLVIRLLHHQNKSVHYWFDGLTKVANQVGGRGLYLFAGPVGSGKTTLMYQLISNYHQEAQVISIEDPVEIKNHQILQLQVNDDIGMTYDNLIKLSLRHRPDILVIGEIRDSQTARAVIRASLTGAMVFSTVHAKSISGVYARLLELGVTKAELSNCLALIAYQRLLNGGALIDSTQNEFEYYSSSNWNQQIDQLLEAGHLNPKQAKLEKII
ncbi:TPA: competence type IV pilus ATPase ComGA [Streptococcus pyogenes]|nr:Flp pilus assembly complex ATPase component TadA [Streptococcus pyogenes]HEP1694325.1 Flp pilus assembly complex ATPase component TadA [Streptococcus pyogenes]HEP1707819.1 Flp pilus assembly complex ATPase component TadA [Streptococcus pyogenes]HEP1708934.1 Flp pilus assembly complex ATPase component TadA [Streptococcus pyogenes]HEP1727819.1 Flp pilus assembly complex ATPase component TadA [Streptococcus pyogenes]